MLPISPSPYCYPSSNITLWCSRRAVACSSLCTTVWWWWWCMVLLSHTTRRCCKFVRLPANLRPCVCVCVLCCAHLVMYYVFLYVLLCQNDVLRFRTCWHVVYCNTTYRLIQLLIKAKSTSTYNNHSHCTVMIIVILFMCIFYHL